MEIFMRIINMFLPSVSTRRTGTGIYRMIAPNVFFEGNMSESALGA